MSSPAWGAPVFWDLGLLQGWGCWVLWVFFEGLRHSGVCSVWGPMVLWGLCFGGLQCSAVCGAQGSVLFGVCSFGVCSA